MMAPLDARTIEHGAVRGVRVENLAFEDAAVLQRQVEYVSGGCVRHRIELYDGRLVIEMMKNVTYATEAAVTPM